MNLQAIKNHVKQSREASNEIKILGFHHPELRPNEVWICNSSYLESTYIEGKEIGVLLGLRKHFPSLRVGQLAFGANGEDVMSSPLWGKNTLESTKRDLKPFFVSLTEVHKKNLIPVYYNIDWLISDQKRGAELPCPKRCNLCDGSHHWMEVSFDPRDVQKEDFEYPIVQLWEHEKEKNGGKHPVSEAPVAFVCKHCRAWKPSRP